MELLPSKFIADVAVPPVLKNGRKRQKLDLCPRSSPPLQLEKAAKTCLSSEAEGKVENNETKSESEEMSPTQALNFCRSTPSAEVVRECPKFGVTSVCGRRRDMEDAVSVFPSFCLQKKQMSDGYHFFGVFDGHGCSHVAARCRDRLHEILKEQVEGAGEAVEWKGTLERSFELMDEEVRERSGPLKSTWSCRCDLQTPQSDAVGSTAVVAIVTPEKIIVSNCGDSRAVLCRNGVAVPLSSDHKPDRPDELLRIEAAGGRVIYWDGARVLGVLAMSRAIGDNYLKPYVISEPEVTITDRTAEDECLIIASDGLWDVVSNETACGVARMCFRAQRPPSPTGSSHSDVAVGAVSKSSDKACSDASILLTKLALARHSTDNVSVVVVDLRRNNHQQSLGLEN